MKRSKRRSNPPITYRMPPKRFRDARRTNQIEGNFYLDDPEAENVRQLPEAQRKSVATAVEAALGAISSEKTGHPTLRDQAGCMVVRVSLTGDAVRANFDARQPGGRPRKTRSR
ncbi:hypothetical protein [Bradyrhizobium iriomotense]|uniref:Uncharacterized protein n=1 Tax=Bradyrhizobium iriomotense TaxID=441950 RepID=A0ABQ6B5T3_9BRAD|nr:hypothetical protein [Bradyrhizobium iriomotense]GLR89742.1 hypothetical protein GCM10007857_64560 [Bradyrhizobium iriomotense]